jgi:hypothetical protein
MNDRGTLRLRPVDPTRGDIDPTLRLDLLTRLAAVRPEPASRSLFEIGPAPQAPATTPLPIKAPTIIPKPLPSAQSRTPGIMPPTVNIPLKYYGFVKPNDKRAGNSGLFLDGDDVLVATEGQVIKGRYLVVELNPNSARLEDTQLRQGQTLAVVPIALQQ